MLLTSAPLLLSLVASQASIDVEAAVRSDVRGGLSPGADATSVAPTADLSLGPSLSATAERHGDSASISYAPTLQLRSQWPQMGGVLGQHSGSLGGRLGDPGRLGQLNGAARLMAGRVDLGTASRLLGQQAGGAVGGAMSVADATAEVSYEVRPMARLTTGAEASTNVGGVPTTAASAANPVAFDALAWLLLPNLAELTPFFRGELAAHADYALSRALQLGGVLSTEGVGRLDPSGFAATSARGRAAWTVTRSLELGGHLGLLAGLEQDGAGLGDGRLVLAPDVDGQLRFNIVLSRQASIDGALAAGLTPSYDLFLGQLTHRASTRGNLRVRWDRLSLSGSASSWSLLPVLTVGAPRPATQLQADAHVVSGDVMAHFLPIDGLEMGAGLTGFVRAQASDDGLLAPPSALLPELMAFAFVRASTSFRH